MHQGGKRPARAKRHLGILPLLRPLVLGLAMLAIPAGPLSALEGLASPPAFPTIYGTPTFPCPPELVPRVTFWLRIFTEFHSGQKVLHDARYPWVVYEVIETDGLSPKQIDSKVNERKRHYSAVLDRLATHAPASWTQSEKRVAALLAEVPEEARFTRARERIRSQTGIRNRFEEGLRRSGRYMHEIEAILDTLGVPAEIACLPHVESSFEPRARSKAGAVGMWQFTSPTGRTYLRIENDMDERLDVPAATEAAGRYLLKARETLDSWPLAVIAYNHGVNGMLRAKARLGTTDLVRVLHEYDGPAFGFASQNFYCEFLAAIEAGRRAEHYFGPVEYDPPLLSLAFPLPQYVKAPVLAEAFGLGLSDLAELNPALGVSFLQGARTLPKGYRLRLPWGPLEEAAAAFASVPLEERFDLRPEPLGYRVQPGDTLGGIARRHRVSITSILKLNQLDNANRIYPGQVLVLPDPSRPGL